MSTVAVTTLVTVVARSRANLAATLGYFSARDVGGVYGGDCRAFVHVVGINVGVRCLQLQGDHSGSAAERAAEGDFDRFPSWTLHERHALRLGSTGEVAVTGGPRSALRPHRGSLAGDCSHTLACLLLC